MYTSVCLQDEPTCMRIEPVSLHRGPPVNIPIRRTAHCSHVIPANDMKGSVFAHQIFLAAGGDQTWDL